MNEVKYEVSGRIARITIDRPERMNAMTGAMYEEISNRLREAEADKQVRAIIVSGDGGRAFSAGHDLYEMGGEPSNAGWQPYRPRRFDSGMECAKPTVAAIDGYCLAGGLELALFCDVRIASDRSQFGSPEVKWNILHGYGALRLPDIIGMSHTMYLLLTGDFIDAETAHRIGLYNRVVPQDRVVAEAVAVAERLARGPSAAIGVTKSALDGEASLDFEAALAYEAEAQAALMEAPNFREAYEAFKEKREPRFT
jgi:enoyl-CoA hydratase